MPMPQRPPNASRLPWSNGTIPGNAWSASPPGYLVPTLDPELGASSTKLKTMRPHRREDLTGNDSGRSTGAAHYAATGSAANGAECDTGFEGKSPGCAR